MVGGNASGGNDDEEEEEETELSVFDKRIIWPRNRAMLQERIRTAGGPAAAVLLREGLYFRFLRRLVQHCTAV